MPREGKLTATSPRFRITQAHKPLKGGSFPGRLFLDLQGHGKAWKRKQQNIAAPEQV